MPDSMELAVRRHRESLAAAIDPRLLPQELEKARALKEEYVAAHPQQGQSRFLAKCGFLARYFESTFNVYVRLKIYPFRVPFTTGVIRNVAKSADCQSTLPLEFPVPEGQAIPLIHVTLHEKFRVKDHTLGRCVISAEQIIAHHNQTFVLHGILIKPATANKEAHYAGDVEIEASCDGQKFTFKLKSLQNLVHRYSRHRQKEGQGKLVYYASLAVGLYLILGVGFFMGTQEWSFIQSLFFCLLTLTTVGYSSSFPGDTNLIINSPGKMWFLSLYILLGIGMIAAALGIVGGFFIDNISHAPHFLHEVLDDDEDQDKVESKSSARARLSACNDKTPASVWIFMVMVMIGTLYYGLVPGASSDGFQWSLIQAFYFSVVTLATIGYGDLFVYTDRGMWFAVFWMTFGTLVTAKCVGDLLNLYLEFRSKNLRQEILVNAFRTEADIASFDEDGNGLISELEWTQRMLVKLKLVSQENLDNIHKRYKLMDTGDTGNISLEEIRRLFKLGPYANPNYAPPPAEGMIAQIEKAVDSVVGAGDASGSGV